jgi:hypothetical protein
LCGRPERRGEREKKRRWKEGRRQVGMEGGRVGREDREAGRKREQQKKKVQLEFMRRKVRGGWILKKKKMDEPKKIKFHLTDRYVG